MPTFDGDNLRIILDPGVSSIDAEVDLYSEWKEWVLLGDNSKYPPAFRTVGGDNLTPGIDAGVYFFIQNQSGWRIRPPEEDITIIFNGNLAPEDSATPVAVPTVGDFTVLLLGLQPITQSVDTLLTLQQESTYEGVIHIDTINGSPGTAYPVGTHVEPVSNLADALTLATTLGIERFEFHGNLVLDQDMVGKVISGVGTPAEVDVNGRNITGSIFNHVALTGDAAGSTDLLIQDGRVVNLENFQAVMVRCGLRGTLKLSPGTGLSEHFWGECAAYTPGISFPVIDLQGQDVDVQIRGHLGSIAFSNMTDPNSDLDIDLTTGVVILDPSVTAGTIVVRGVGIVVDNSAGASVDKSGVINASTGSVDVPTLVNAVWDEALVDHVVSGSMGEAQGRLDTTISSRAQAGDAMALTSAERAALASAVWAVSLSSVTGTASAEEILTCIFDSTCIAKIQVTGSSYQELQTDLAGVSTGRYDGMRMLIVHSTGTAARIIKRQYGDGRLEFVRPFNFTPAVGDFVFVLPGAEALAGKAGRIE